MPLPKSLSGDRWAAVTARKILPLLVSYAESCQELTYGEVDDEVVRRRWGHHVLPVTYRFPAGAIGFALIETEKKWRIPIPPINALIVNERTRLPGSGEDYFLRSYLRQKDQQRKLTEAQRRSIVEETHKDIFNFADWRKILNDYGLASPPSIRNRPRATRNPVRKYNWTGGPESEGHKKLKQYIAEHPEAVRLPLSCAPGKIEYLLPSADEIDVLFADGGWLTGVEVKASGSNEDDVLRGVFQCVKYRELLRAEQRILRLIPQARSLLVTERPLPRSARRAASILRVPHLVIDLNTGHSPPERNTAG